MDGDFVMESQIFTDNPQSSAGLSEEDSPAQDMLRNLAHQKEIMNVPHDGDFSPVSSASLDTQFEAVDVDNREIAGEEHAEASPTEGMDIFKESDITFNDQTVEAVSLDDSSKIGEHLQDMPRETAEQAHILTQHDDFSEGEAELIVPSSLRDEVAPQSIAREREDPGNQDNTLSAGLELVEKPSNSETAPTADGSSAELSQSLSSEALAIEHQESGKISDHPDPIEEIAATPPDGLHAEFKIQNSELNSKLTPTPKKATDTEKLVPTPYRQELQDMFTPPLDTPSLTTTHCSASKRRGFQFSEQTALVETQEKLEESTVTPPLIHAATQQGFPGSILDEKPVEERVSDSAEKIEQGAEKTKPVPDSTQNSIRALSDRITELEVRITPLTNSFKKISESVQKLTRQHDSSQEKKRLDSIEAEVKKVKKLLQSTLSSKPPSVDTTFEIRDETPKSAKKKASSDEAATPAKKAAVMLEKIPKLPEVDASFEITPHRRLKTINSEPTDVIDAETPAQRPSNENLPAITPFLHVTLFFHGKNERALDNKTLIRRVEFLGGKVNNDTDVPHTHLVTLVEECGRCLKALIALAHDIPIVAKDWISQSYHRGAWIDPTPFRCADIPNPSISRKGLFPEFQDAIIGVHGETLPPFEDFMPILQALGGEVRDITMATRRRKEDVEIIITAANLPAERLNLETEHMPHLRVILTDEDLKAMLWEGTRDRFRNHFTQQSAKAPPRTPRKRSRAHFSMPYLQEIQSSHDDEKQAQRIYPVSRAHFAATQGDTFPPLVVGRSQAHCAFILPYNGVSRVHFALQLARSGDDLFLHIADKKSTNGLFVNGRKREEKTLLREHDVVLVGGGAGVEPDGVIDDSMEIDYSAKFVVRMDHDYLN